MQDTENTDEWVTWIEEAIVKGYFKSYEYKHFNNTQVIGSGAFGKVYCANWKDSAQRIALKSFFDLNNVTVKEIVHELKLQREIQFHDNIINFYGVTKFESGIIHRDLHSDIKEGLREDSIPDTPENCIKLYTDCWDA
ncbi:unnamed protein product [Rhizophagus irregularis]|nr:unnamed protein product [Rhizophagus irregularis]